MNIRLYNARILTMEPGREVFYGEVWVKNDKIAYVAEQKELAEEWDKSQFPRIAWEEYGTERNCSVWERSACAIM